MPDHASSFPLLFRYDRSVTDQGRVHQLPGCPTGAESASRGGRGGELLYQLIRGAELLLAKRGEKALGMCTVTVSSLCFWKLVILSPCSLPSLSMWPLYFLPIFFQSLLALFKHSFNSLYSNTSFSPCLPQATCIPSHVVFPSSPQKKCSVFKWPVGLGPPFAGDCSSPTYRGLIV